MSKHAAAHSPKCTSSVIIAPLCLLRVFMDFHSGLRCLASAGQVEPRPYTTWEMTPGWLSAPFRLFESNSTRTCEARLAHRLKSPLFSEVCCSTLTPPPSLLWIHSLFSLFPCHNVDSHLLSLDLLGGESPFLVDVQRFRPQDAVPPFRGCRSCRLATQLLGSARHLAIAPERGLQS